jgi:hypothetical protein
MSEFSLKEAVMGLGLFTFGMAAYGLDWQIKQDAIMNGYVKQIESQQQLNEDLRESNRLLRERLELQERVYKVKRPDFIYPPSLESIGGEN